jgi:hypothetical protein
MPAVARQRRSDRLAFDHLRSIHASIPMPISREQPCVSPERS